jgi:predicted DNA-binding transcriptional regulator AlpA
MKTHHETTQAVRDRLVTFQEALATLGISKSNAYRLLEQGALPRPIKIGKRTFFSERELQGWIASKLAGRGREVGDE